jgi:hypothetical protein
MPTTEVQGSEVRFKVGAGSKPPHAPYFDGLDGHEGAFMVPTSPLVAVSTIQPAAEQASLTRFVLPRSVEVTGGALIVDTGSSSGDLGECAIWDGTLEHKLGGTGPDYDLQLSHAGVQEFTFEEPVTIVAGNVYYFVHSNPYGDCLLNANLYISNFVAELFGAEAPEVIAAIYGAADVASTLSTDLTGANNDLKFTAATPGADGDDISVEYVDPAASGEALSVDVVGTAITVNLETEPDVQSELETTLTGANNDLLFTAAAGLPGTAGDAVSVEFVDPATPDAALDVTVAGTDITVDLATDGGGAIVSTAAQVAAAVTGDVDANVLVTVANAPGNDGTGVVTALAQTNLAGGFDGGALLSTAAEVEAAVEGATGIVTVANKVGNNGTGVVTAMTLENLAGGVSNPSGYPQPDSLVGANSYTASVLARLDFE